MFDITGYLGINGGALNLHGRNPHRKKKRDAFLSKEFRKPIGYVVDHSLSPLAPPETYEDIGGKEAYAHSVEWAPITHIGQRKLFLNEVQFLTKLLPTADSRAYVVYAGAAPSNHMGLLSEMFPEVRFVLVDPHEFRVYMPTRDNDHYSVRPSSAPVYLRAGRIKMYETGPRNIGVWNGREVVRINRDEYVDDADWMSRLDYIVRPDSARIILIEDLFTNELAKGLERVLSGTPTYFMCDIRTIVSSTETAPGDIDILWNLAQQYNWIIELKPAASMLKFRTPYRSVTDAQSFKNDITDFIKADLDLAMKYGLDIMGDYMSGGNTINYLDGVIMIQPWAGPSSTESRLVTEYDWVSMASDASMASGTPPIVKYDSRDYEDTFFYYNKRMRASKWFVNDRANKDYGFDHCADCALENKIIKDYELKYSRPMINYLARVRMATGGRTLFARNHGKSFPPNSV